MYMHSSRRCSRFNGIIFKRLGFSTFHYGLNSETPFKPTTISILFERWRGVGCTTLPKLQLKPQEHVEQYGLSILFTRQPNG